MQELTSRQQEILDLIRSHIDETGYPPTRAEIAERLGFKSANAAEEHLKALARIARLLRDQDVAKKLRASRDAQAIYSVLALPPASAA